MKLSVVLLLLGTLAFVAAEIKPRFPPNQPVTVGGGNGGTVTGRVLPCDFDYYRIETFDNVEARDWFRIQFTQTPQANGDFGKFFLVHSEYDNLEQELDNNDNIVDTLGELPGPDNFDYVCEGASCTIELSCELQDGTYYIAVTGGESSITAYTFSLTSGSANVTTLRNAEPIVALDRLRDLSSPVARVKEYAFYSINVPTSAKVEGAYLLVNISRVSTPGTVVRLHYENLPVAADDSGILDTDDGTCVYDGCVDTSSGFGEPIYDYPVNTQPRIPCACSTFEQIVGAGRQLTCNVTVDPCQMLYGTWYISVELPARANNNDNTNLDYTLYAVIVQPFTTALIRNTTYKGFVAPESQTHYKLEVPASEVVAGDSHLIVQVDNVRNGFVDIWVHKGESDQVDPRAGGVEACHVANATCRTDDACNVVVEKCHFSPGTWYISVSIPYTDDNGFLVDDYDRLPITYTIRATWVEDAVPTRLVAGVPVHKYIGEALYDFYVIDVPPTIDTWLFVELYAQQEDTEVILSMLHGSLPGGECYDRPDFYCLTGDVRGLKIETGPPFPGFSRPLARESCTFMIQTCELEQGPLYLSVYGHHVGYTAYGDTTYYQVPVHYTLYADFDVALSVQSAVSYSENVFERQYNHYYIRADNAVQGQYLSVELTNIQHGVPQTLEAFVNYNFLAGNCPCYDHLYNCTGAVAPSCGNAIPSTEPNFIPHPEVVHTCCTILVPACDFRSGVWYISVLGVNEDLVQYTTPIGYTLTATIHDAPVIKPLIPGQLVPDEVTQWNRTNQYTHYKIGAKPIPNHDLVIKVTYAQNCEFLPKHDNLRDTIDVFVNRGGVAGDRCFDYHGHANIVGTSYETIVIPACEWTDDDYFVAVQGNFDAVFPGRYTISAHVVEISDTQLVSGVSVYGRATHARYQHFFIEVPEGITNTDLLIELYTNSDQDSVTAFLNKDYRAGEDQCYEYLEGFRCETESSCSWQIQACQLEAGRYYISVYGDVHQFYDIAVEFTLTATLVNTVTALGPDQPFTAHIQAGHIQHYSLTVSESKSGDYIKLLVDNVKHGSVQVYYNYNDLAGLCPCYDYIATCSAHDEATEDWCEITVPSCEFADGIYYFAVVGLTNTTPDPPLYLTPIGYTIEIDYITPSFVTPDVVRDRFTANTETFQLIGNELYNHYLVDVSQSDYDAGYQVIVEITNVRDGALNVYWTDEEPGHNVDSCQVAQICTAGLGAGAECHWQIPYCLSGAGRHYVTVEGITGRNQGSYDILIWLQRPANLASNPTFTLDNAASTFNFPAASSVAIAHNKTNEPNGWVQFIRLDNVALTDAEDGEILEVFFYNVRNNVGASVAFNVYLWPEVPAGSGDCCNSIEPATPEELGNCVDQECLRTVPLTTYNPGNIGVAPLAGTQPTRGAAEDHDDTSNNNVCLAGVTGSGPVPTGANSPFFGERCIARVWACDAAAAASGTKNWWLTVVPVAPANAALSPLNGLSYNVQWRVRNVRTLGTGSNSVGTTDLTSAINAANTNTFTITTQTTESEAFASFSVDVDPKGEAITSHRIVIQTEFISGVGEVYIRAESFANPLDCHEYICTSDEDCDGVDRFIQTECCNQAVTKYYITVRNLGGDNSQLSFRFRISEIDQPEVSKVNLPFNITVAGGAAGLRGEQYDFYSFNLAASDFVDGNSLIVDLTKTNNNGAPIQVFLQYGEIAGSFDGVANDKFETAEGCYNSELSCTLTDVNAHCYLEQPHCQLLAGTYYVSVYNPTPDFTGALTNNGGFLSYTLGVAVTADPAVLTLGTTATGSFNAQDVRYFQYKLEVPASALETTNNGNTGFLTNILRIQTTSNNGNVDLFVNFDFIAADPADLQCGDFIASDAACQTGGCLIDFIPCDGDFTLKAGTYYIGIRVNAPSTWSITAAVVSELYPLLTSTSQTGVQHRAGTTNEIYTTRGNQGTAVDGYFRYAINIPGDFTSGRDYLVFNLTSTQTGAISGPINVRIWRQDCQIWTCSVTTASSWCVIDAIGLAPCSARAGTYFIRVENPSNAGFVLNAYHNETTVQDIIDDQTITEITYPNEYQAYFYDATTIGKDASTLTITATTTCGAVEVFVQKDTIGGPSSDDGECAISSCVTEPADETDNVFTCTIFLDVCTFEQRGYYITVRGTQQTFPNTDNSNLYLPIRYSLNVHQTDVTTVPVASYCSNIVQRITESDDLEHSPVQFSYDLENAETGAILEFLFYVPAEVRNGNEVATFTVTYQKPGSYGSGDDCDYERAPLTCTISGANAQCSIVITPSCVHLEGRYYILADAPRGTEVVVQLWDPSVYILDEHEIVTATINADSLPTGFDFPIRPGYQIYRFDYEPKNDEHFFLQAELFDVTQGTASIFVSTGQYPVLDADEAFACGSGFGGPLEASEGEDATIYANYCDLGYSDEVDGYHPTTLWIVISGIEQLCELHSIKYSLRVTTHIEPEILDLDEVHCHSVEPSSFNFYHLSPRTSPRPQDSIVVYEFTDVSAGGSLLLSLLDNEGFLATGSCSDYLATYGVSGVDTVIPIICGHSDLTFSLQNVASSGPAVDYRLVVREQAIVLNELVADEAFLIDEACPSDIRNPVAEYDFFRFDASALDVDRVSFISFTIESDDDYEIYIRSNRLGADTCYDVDSATSSDTSVLYDFGCDGFAREYYVSVKAVGAFTITAHVEEKIVDLKLGSASDVTIVAGSAAVFRLNITSAEVTPGSRLSIISSGILHDSLEYFFTYDNRAGEYDTPTGLVSCADQHYTVDQRASQGYDYLEVPGCSFYPGTYWLTIRAAESSQEDVSSCDDITLTLTPSVISYELDITTIQLNATTTNQKVYAIPRDVNTESPFKFYRVDVTDKGSEALGQLSVRNVDGGVVTAYISRLAFPLPPNLWVKGQVTGLSTDGLIRSGVRAHTPIASTSYDIFRNPSTTDFIGLTAGGNLYIFNSDFPESGAFFPVEDLLTEDEQIVGIDFRPRDGKLYALGSDSHLYTLAFNPESQTIVATILNDDQFATQLDGSSFGFDFNPVADRIRVTSDTNQNLRLNQIAGTLAAVDTPVTPATTNPVGAAYTNSVSAPAVTTLYIIDSVTDSLYIQGGIDGPPSPNGGVLTLVGPLGVDTDDDVGFDILPEAKLGFATLTVGSSSGLYSINLETGHATFLGSTSDYTIVSLAIVPATAPTGEALGSCADFSCTSVDGSCSIDLTPCGWGPEPFYIAVAAEEQFSDDIAITYDIVLNGYPKYREIVPNSNVVDSFDGNTASHYFAGITDGQQSIRFRTEVINGDGVLVTVRNHQCPDRATWVREVYCSGRFYDNKFQCDIDISTRAHHPGSLTTTFFATVTGTNATFSISFFAGRQNCHDFSGTGAREGLSFCSGLVPYSTYRWENYQKRDESAKCLFNELYDHFRVQPCWSGVTPECNSTLQRFACYENFHRCDADGFAVGTCRKACEAVVFECVNWFESVDLEHYNCTSSRYIDSNHACTGHLENEIYDEDNFLDNPLDIIYQEDLPREKDSASSLSASFALVFFALVAAFLGLF